MIKGDRQQENSDFVFGHLEGSDFSTISCIMGMRLDSIFFKAPRAPLEVGLGATGPLSKLQKL
jgi:hypothetical protein